MKFQLIRNATILLQYAGQTLLIDPMFSEEGANPPIMNTANDRRNPLVPLPVPLTELISPDAVFITHTHLDHWDSPAAKQLPKSVPVFCQPEDLDKIRDEAGFTIVTPMTSQVQFQEVTIIRTGGHHGTGEIGERMGPVSGFVLQAEGEPTIYIAGDTIWCDEVAGALDSYKPEITIVNAGGARFITGDPIIMDENDVISVCRNAPYTKVVAVHMEAINHCLVSRSDLRAKLEQEGLQDQVFIPEDGEFITL